VQGIVDSFLESDEKCLTDSVQKVIPMARPNRFKSDGSGSIAGIEMLESEVRQRVDRQ
jgi:hypothetical protein